MRTRKGGWNLGWLSAVDCEGRTVWIANAHRDDGKRFVVHADEKLTAFTELELAIGLYRPHGGIETWEIACKVLKVGSLGTAFGTTGKAVDIGGNHNFRGWRCG